MHATVMIFLFVIPMLAGFGNYVVPLQIGAPDMAFPRINALSLLDAAAGRGPAPLGLHRRAGRRRPGWTSYSPLVQDRPLRVGTGQDLWIVALMLIGTSSILGAINFLVTIFKMRAPGHDAVPDADHGLDGPRDLRPRADGDAGHHERADHAVHRPQLRRLFFDPRVGGDAILYQNVFWFYSHPAVYVMVLPAMGIISEILPVFSRKPLFGYKAFIFATAAIGALGFSRVGPPHVHDRRGLPAVLQPHDVPHRRPDRGEDVQLDLHDVARPADASRRRCCSPSAS